MMDTMSAAVLALLAANCYYYTSAQSVVNVASGIFSKKTESNGLTLPATDTFQPITTLTTNIHIELLLCLMVSNVTLHRLLPMHMTRGVVLEILKLFCIY